MNDLTEEALLWIMGLDEYCHNGTEILPESVDNDESDNLVEYYEAVMTTLERIDIE